MSAPDISAGAGPAIRRFPALTANCVGCVATTQPAPLSQRSAFDAKMSRRTSSIPNVSLHSG